MGQRRGARHVALDAIALPGVGLMILHALVTRQTALAVEGGIVCDIRVRIMAGDAREIPFLKTPAAHQPDCLIADVDGRIGIAFRLIAMTCGAEVNDRLRVEATRIRDGSLSFRMFPRSRMAALAGYSRREAGLVW